ncbi:sorting nexin-2 isoform X1 [Anopheles arabiensis]|uniref:sorting nexin-2 isoform X1 n=1 Tax=Anopheles arabiensis TaxID=7173 RepID=UPI001AADCC8A|nr:sorting nexin-2 isoform X1 [Anopheles arabiensis]XP_040233889.1 sorting nexin-2 isoform X1 [Anopheles coluzzii]XP_041776167.1 sorting nexin-2 isoform X1 [Anopheles merus]XP_061510322.1 sorting nexin-2 isoform X2 [Anopheles gambiae]
MDTNGTLEHDGETEQTQKQQPAFDNVDITSPDDENENDIFESAIQQEPLSPVLEDVPTDEAGDTFIEIVVADPQKVGDGMGSYLAYKVSTKTNILKFKKRQFFTMRRFSDFLGLHDLLVSKYLRMGRIIPPAPEKNIIGTTKVRMGSQPQAEAGAGVNLEWIENRRASLERFLNRVAQHPVLCQDTDFVNFLESDQELPRAVNTAALSGAGVMRLFNKVGETVNKITYKMDENDPWFNDKISEVETIDAHMQKLHSAIKALVSHRKELATLTGGVAKSAALLSTCEEHTGLSQALSQLADVEEKVELLRSEQANSDLYILSETIKDYIGLFGAIKDVFHERVKVFQNWQHAQMQLTKKRENKAKLELQDRRDKLEFAQKEVEEWEGKVQRCQKEFDNISSEIKKEMERFELARARDFKSTIIKYLEDQMAHQQQQMRYWEAIVPVARDIA